MPNLPPPNVPRALPGPNVRRTDIDPNIHPKWKTPLTTDANPFAQVGRLINPIMRNPAEAAENALMLYGAPGALLKLGGAIKKYGPPLAAGALTFLGGSDEAQSGKASYITKLAGNLFNNMMNKPVSRKARSPEEYNRLASLNTQIRGTPTELKTSAENAVLDGANINEVIEAVKKVLQHLQRGM